MTNGLVLALANQNAMRKGGVFRTPQCIKAALSLSQLHRSVTRITIVLTNHLEKLPTYIEPSSCFYFNY